MGLIQSFVCRLKSLRDLFTDYSFNYILIIYKHWIKSKIVKSNQNHSTSSILFNTLNFFS